MAQVKLDISEYELMKEKSMLLEKALKKEEKLNKQIAKLNQEKIDALLENEKTVTVITKVNTHQIIKSRRSESDIKRHLRNRIRRVSFNVIQAALKHSDGRNHFMSDRHMYPRGMSNHRMRDEVEHAVDHYMREEEPSFANIHELFYSKEEFKVNEEEPVIIRKGLDQVKEEIRSEVYEELSLKAKKALDINPTLAKERDDATDEVKILSKRLKLSESLDKKKSEEIDKLQEEVTEVQYNAKENTLKLSDINLVVSEEIGIFGNKKKLKQIKQILNENE